MENILVKNLNRRIIHLFSSLRFNHTQAEPQYPTSTQNIMDKERLSHPYHRMHPWRSKIEFCESMKQQVIYHEDGLIAINKPYGISARIKASDEIEHRTPSGIPNEVNYTIADALPEISKEFGYDSLEIIRTPEKYTSGVILLSASRKIEKAIEKSLRIAEGFRIIPRTYWTVTRRVPQHIEGEKRIAMTLKRSKERRRPVPVIIDSWSKNQRERGDIKILNVQYKVLCHGTYNLASLLEIKSSTTQWHAIRLFAASVLLSPILGDRIYGSRVQNVMNKWIKINPMVDAAHIPPKLDPELSKILKIQKNKDDMIPVHIHLREMFLPSFLKKNNDIFIEAPLYSPFLWTCRELKFDETVFENNVLRERQALTKRNEIT